MDADENKRAWLGLATTLASLLAVYLASDPDAPARWWYQLKLWLAYRKPQPNRARLERLRRLYDLGAFADDSTPSETRLGDILSER